MVRSSQVSYLRLVDAPSWDEAEPGQNELEGPLLGFVDMSKTSADSLTAVLSYVCPAWVFDLRPVPYFNIGSLNRKRAFELFRKCGTSYRDVTGALHIVDRNDASLNSGAVAAFLNGALSAVEDPCSVVVLVDHAETLAHAMKVLPGSLRCSSGAWCPMVLETAAREGDSTVVLRSARGEPHVFAPRWSRVNQRDS